MRTHTVDAAASHEEAADEFTVRPTRAGSEVTEPGRLAGRLAEGLEARAEGSLPLRLPPRWIRTLEREGYDPDVDGDLYYVVSREGGDEIGKHAHVRSALAAALELLHRDGDCFPPDSLVIECRTRAGRSVTVVAGRALVGMALGAHDTATGRAMAPAHAGAIQDDRGTD